MLTPEQLAESFALNARLIQRQTDGLTHADSLIQTPYNLNALNWVLGHILVNRDRVLALLDKPPLLSDTERKRYETESPPVKCDGDALIPLERMLELFKQGQAMITAGLTQITPDALTKEIPSGERRTTSARHLFGLYFHDTYHTGQTDLLRQVAGKNDKII
jgi:uncharacterized damage-inducible protein DinB